MMAATAYERVTERLTEVTGFDPRGRGDWRCPAHDDRTASLSVNRGDKGALLHCHAQCSVNAIVEALGLTISDLFDERPEASDRPTIVATYDYVDEHGALRFQTVRFSPKTFRQRRPDGTGGWIWNLEGVSRVLYRLPEVCAAVKAGRAVWVVEGEKDADTMSRAGETATCSPMGAGKWRSEFNGVLAGARVVIVADKDPAGWAHTLDVHRHLQPVAAEVRIVEARKGKDAADHLAAGYRPEDFLDVTVEDLASRCAPAAAVPALNGHRSPTTPPPAALPPGEPCQAAWPELASEALYGLAGDVVAQLEPYTESDPAALLLQLLAGFGNAVGAGPHAVADAARHPARLFVCIVGETAKARKGTSWRNVAAVLRSVDAAWMEQRVKSGLSSGEGLIAAVADTVIGEDGKIISHGSRDRRLFVIEEEFARVLQVSRREASTLSPILRQAYDTGDLKVLTKVAQSATDAHITVVGQITAEELRARLTETDMANGLANRFLFCCARRSKRLPHPAQPDPALYAGLAARITESLQRARPAGQVSFDPDAATLWARLYHEMADDEPGGLLGSVVARPEAHTLRLAVTYALLDGETRIRTPHLQAAWAVWSYCRQSAEHVFGDALGDEHADRLLQAIRHAGAAGFDGTAQSDLFSRNLNAKRLAALRTRIGDRIVTVEVETGGRPRMVSYAAGHAPT